MEKFQSSRINNRIGCGTCDDQLIQTYPCCNQELYETISYPYENPNYDLMKETHDWSPEQYVPKLLLPQIKQYKELSGRDNCYINTANKRSTLYANYCPQLACDPQMDTSPSVKETFSNPFPPHWNAPPCYVNTANPRSTMYGCDCPELGCDVETSKKKEKFSNLLVEHRERIRQQPFCGYYYQETNIPEVGKFFTPSIAYDPMGYDSLELQSVSCSPSINID